MGTFSGPKCSRYTSYTVYARDRDPYEVKNDAHRQSEQRTPGNIITRRETQTHDGKHKHMHANLLEP